MNFDPPVVAPQVLELVIRAPPDEISRAVERSCAVRVGDEAFPGQARPTEVAARDTCATYVKFSRRSLGQQSTLRAQYIDLRIT